jgi:cullin-4
VAREYHEWSPPLTFPLPQVTIRWIFYYLDQSFLLHSKEQPVIREMGLIQFRSYIFSDASLKPKILKGAYDLIEADRGGSTKALTDSKLLSDAMDLFHDLDVYGSDFEPLFMAKTEEFVKEWAQQQAAGSLAAYVEHAHQLIEREVERCGLFSFNRSTKLKLSELLDETLVTQRTDMLTSENEVLGLMRAGNKTALKQLYGLLDRRDLTLELKPAFKKYVIEEGEAIVFDQERETDMVVHLLQFKQKVDDIWTSAFESNEELGDAVREAFGAFMNRGKKMDSTGGTDNPKSGEMIAKYVDRLLKGGYKLPPGRNPEEVSLMSDDAELDRQLDQVLDLFRFVHGKAVFEAFYKNDLARRLLMKRSASNDAEKSMLARLKNGLSYRRPYFCALCLTFDQNAGRVSLITSSLCLTTWTLLMMKWRPSNGHSRRSGRAGSNSKSTCSLPPPGRHIPMSPYGFHRRLRARSTDSRRSTTTSTQGASSPGNINWRIVS